MKLNHVEPSFTATKNYLPHTWMDPRVVAEESGIHGMGLFTKEPFKKGETVMIWGGIKIPNSEYADGKYRETTLVPIDDAVDLGLPITDTSESLDEYLNHSCDPTAWLTDEVTVVARRDIDSGEEITVDAATWCADEEYPYSEDSKCLCGSSLCRRTLTPKDYLLPELQKRYVGHFSPYLAKRIAKVKSAV